MILMIDDDNLSTGKNFSMILNILFQKSIYTIH